MEDRETRRAQSADSRFTRREEVRIAAEIREAGGGKTKIDVLDLSVTGFRMHSLAFINPESRVYLTMPGMAPLAAQVAWTKGDYYGCHFDNPLYPAVFDHIVSRFPSLGED
ncbi:PilZ domain-containing protein [Novosphingopyxis sp. YJ-S2-01]|uniref:PilZ domain-containing protein n=1 Tax=Novosphingopyxis sp. YJ-S2-01 TaxID=2794021 RepID=UPI0018DD817E|nr:PilZ domain-containing protein [Novosphingopyxis sp. YJ-S2-01]MBH9536900.1 PilZ domain-containing protein [Novosphingopyxis sp. YJ-S2-01]